jgi:hypothetical protein
MTINPPRRVRALIYIANVLGAPFIAYAFAKGWVGELEVTLFSAEVSAAFLLAGLNTAPSDTRDDAGGVDLNTVAGVLLVVFLVLVILSLV